MPIPTFSSPFQCIRHSIFPPISYYPLPISSRLHRARKLSTLPPHSHKKAISFWLPPKNFEFSQYFSYFLRDQVCISISMMVVNCASSMEKKPLAKGPPSCTSSKTNLLKMMTEQKKSSSAPPPRPGSLQLVLSSPHGTIGESTSHGGQQNSPPFSSSCGLHQSHIVHLHQGSSCLPSSTFCPHFRSLSNSHYHGISSASPVPSPATES